MDGEKHVLLVYWSKRITQLSPPKRKYRISRCKEGYLRADLCLNQDMIIKRKKIYRYVVQIDVIQTAVVLLNSWQSILNIGGVWGLLREDLELIWLHHT